MTRRYLKLAIVGSIFTLSACAQQSEIRQMNQSVSTLSKEMTQLNQQTVKITQQNVLNAKSNSGVYLLPEAKTPARLKSQIGTLRMSLLNIAPDGDGTRLTLRIQGESNDPLPAFSATVASGQISGTTDSYQEVNVQNQLISAPASVLAERCRHSAAPEWRDARAGWLRSHPRYSARQYAVMPSAGCVQHPAFFPLCKSIYRFPDRFTKN